MENIILSCLESKNVPFVEHLLCECNLLGKILEAEKNCMLASDPNMVFTLSYLGLLFEGHFFSIFFCLIFLMLELVTFLLLPLF